MIQHQKASHDSKQIKNQKDDILLACLWCGNQPSLHRYLHHLDPSHNPICLKCCLNEQDLNHWLCECPEGCAIRQQVFGNHKGSLEWLATWPGDVLAYSRRTWPTLMPNQVTSLWLTSKHTHIYCKFNLSLYWISTSIALGLQ